MTGRQEISKMILGILNTRKQYVMIPKRLSEHIVSTIERPEQNNRNYRTGTLIDYLHERRMSLVVTNRMFGERIVVDSDEKIHYAIKRGMNFYQLSDGDLISDGIDYHTTPNKTVSISIDRFCALMERLNYNIEITNKN